jgi:hypothetical protein
MALQHESFTYDNALLLKAAGLVASSAAESTILDLGDSMTEGYLIIDVSAVETASTDEIYDVYLEGSNVAAMSSGSVCLARIQMGNATAPADADTSTGRFVVPFRNEQNGTLYRYVRVGTVVAGTIATGINYRAFIAKTHS